jgi:hypothetical protein
LFLRLPVARPGLLLDLGDEGAQLNGFGPPQGVVFEIL